MREGRSVDGTRSATNGQGDHGRPDRHRGRRGRRCGPPDRHCGQSDRQRRGRRGQANLVALVAALFALTTAMVVGISFANGALVGETRAVHERHAAAGVARGLVSADSPLTNRTNVLDRGDVRTLTATALYGRYPVLDGRSVRVTLGDERLVSRGTPAGGTTVRRLVLVERTTATTIRPRFSAGNRATLPRRTRRVTVALDPPENVSITAVRADGRTVLYDPDEGLAGRYTVTVSPRETVRLTFVANGSLARGDATVTLYPRTTTKAVLGVTVDD